MEVISREIKVVVVTFCLQWTRESSSNFYTMFPMPHPSISTQGTYCLPMVSIANSNMRASHICRQNHRNISITFWKEIFLSFLQELVFIQLKVWADTFNIWNITQKYIMRNMWVVGLFIHLMISPFIHPSIHSFPFSQLLYMMIESPSNYFHLQQSPLLQDFYPQTRWHR